MLDLQTQKTYTVPQILLKYRCFRNDPPKTQHADQTVQTQIVLTDGHGGICDIFGKPLLFCQALSDRLIHQLQCLSRPLVFKSDVLWLDSEFEHLPPSPWSLALVQDILFKL